MYTLAVDIGGTFTDCVAIDEADGRLTTCKVPTTQDDLQRGVFNGLDRIASALDLSTAALLGGVSRFVHATTQSSNAVFAGTGARTAVVTTRGFGDTLLIMRATGRVAGLSVFERHHYRNTQKPAPLADEGDIFEVGERIDHKGSVVVALDDFRNDQDRAVLRTIAFFDFATEYKISQRCTILGFTLQLCKPIRAHTLDATRTGITQRRVCISSAVAGKRGHHNPD